MKRRTLLKASATAVASAGLIPSVAKADYHYVQEPGSLGQLLRLLPGGTIPANAYQEGVWVTLPTIEGLTGNRSWPINPIHMAMLPNGKVLSYGSRGDVLQAGVVGQDGSQTVIWNPDTLQFSLFDDGRGRKVPYKNYRDRPTANAAEANTKFNSFCSGGALMPNGNLLMVGGSGGQYRIGSQTAASKMTGVFDYRSNEAQQLTDANVQQGRWYSTVITLADGKQLVVGGMEPYAEDNMDANLRAPGDDIRNTALAPIVFDGKRWRSLPGIDFSTYATYFQLAESRAEFPRAWVAPGGSVFGISTEKMWALDPNGGGSMRAAGTDGKFADSTMKATDNTSPTSSLPNVGSGSSSAVMYDKGLVLQAGGNGYWVLNGSRASSKATVVDIRQGAVNAVAKSPGDNLKAPRKFFNMTALPSGQVLINGGTTRLNVNAAQHVLRAELFEPKATDPSTGNFRSVATQRYSRVYHSTAILLPDGTVLSAGGGNPHVVQRNAEIYLPPYLFTRSGSGSALAKRPTLWAVSANKVNHGECLSPYYIGLTDTSGENSIADVVLVGLSTVTHGFNTGQRRIRLERADWSAGVYDNKTYLQVHRFPTADITPPGYYMMFVMNQAGVPSRGVIIAVGEQTLAPGAQV